MPRRGMTPAALRALCLSIPQAFETFPFDDTVSVFKVKARVKVTRSGNGRMFALSTLGATPLTVSVKVDPEDSIALQAQYRQITPGYHLNKKHWITVVLDGGVPDDLVEELIRGSYSLVRPLDPRAS